MTSRSHLHATLLATLALGIAFSDNASSAERDLTSVHQHKYRRVASIEEIGPPGIPCRTGWWQTLKDGHVRPHWGTVCY
jgi:hypothetical protein